MNNSILSDIKKQLGLANDYMTFDTDIIVQINSCLFTLFQIGVPMNSSFRINGYEEKWDDLTNVSCLDLIKSYIYLKVKSIFDPPQSVIVSEAYNRQISELEWRISCSVDPKDNIFDEKGSDDYEK